MVILEYLPITGGAQRQLAAVAPLLRAAGAEIHVITRRAGTLPGEETLEGVRIHRLAAPGPKAIASLVFTALALLRLRGLRPDVVHAYSLFSPATIGVLARRILRVPVVVKVLRGGRAGDVERLRRKPLSGLRVAALRRSIDRFISISQEIDDELEALGIDENRRIAIPNGVDVRRHRPCEPDERRALRASLGLPEGPLLAYVGRLVPEKRVDLLLSVWRDMGERPANATLLIVGGGPCEAELRRNASDDVRFAGEVDDVTPWLRAADLFVLPSATEGLSNALLEAMAAGLPIVATRVGAAAELIDDGRSGRLVPAEDEPAMREALQGLLDPRGRADPEALGHAARATAVERYALEGVAERLVALYREVLCAASPEAPAPAAIAPRKTGEGLPR
jgi:glycosyltransferase involved in cell wall biosynthesis